MNLSRYTVLPAWCNLTILQVWRAKRDSCPKICLVQLFDLCYPLCAHVHIHTDMVPTIIYKWLFWLYFNNRTSLKRDSYDSWLVQLVYLCYPLCAHMFMFKQTWYQVRYMSHMCGMLNRVLKLKWIVMFKMQVIKLSRYHPLLTSTILFEALDNKEWHNPN
jgi:hypothetical protein